MNKDTLNTIDTINTINEIDTLDALDEINTIDTLDTLDEIDTIDTSDEIDTSDKILKKEKINLLKNTNKSVTMLKGLYEAKQDLMTLPFDLGTSTTTVTCCVETNFNVENIGLYFNDFDNIFIGKRFGNRVINNLVNIKKVRSGKKKKRKEKKNFYNQVSLIVRSCTLMGLDPSEISLKDSIKTVNIKLFVNGSIQMTGCKHLDNIRKSLELLFEKLKITKVIMNKDLDYFEKPFVEDKSKLDIIKVNKFCIQMINTNFNMEFQINRTKLYQLLIESNIYTSLDPLVKANKSELKELMKDVIIDVTFDPIIHACVNIKYHLKENKTKTISIFVFESGSITIAGSNSSKEILEVYNFINKFILINYNKLLTKDITPSLIIEFINKINFNE
jgi:TATA-box binding protein (TBP) (component of TFIID and TFIIIB)